MSKIFIVTVLALFGVIRGGSPILKQHPVREEIVNEIKAKATRWTPVELEDNYFKDVPVHRL
jgi:hypothetical protein